MNILISCNQVKLSDARDQLINGEFHTASESYQSIYRGIPRDQLTKRGIVSFEIAETYKNLNRTTRALNSYRNAIRFGYPDTLIYLYYSQMLHREGDYLSAIDAYKEYFSMSEENVLALNGLKGAEQSVEWIKNPTRYKVARADQFNSGRSEFSPMLYMNDNFLYFTSSRDTSTGDQKSLITGIKYNDLFISEKNVMGEWKVPKKLESEINTKFDEGTPSFTSDGRYMFYTFSYYDENQSTAPQIYYSRRVNGLWTAGKQLTIAPNYSNSTFAHPSISASGKYLYFVSDMPGGFGGKDIWRAQLTSTFKVIDIQNLGTQVNTPGNEMFPYIRNEETLYFSSDGHPGMGGLDLFVARHVQNSDEWIVENLKSPINSSADDFGITFYNNAEKGFFSSNRDDNRGYDNIYTFELPNLNIKIEGIVTDSEDEFIENAIISIADSDGLQIKFITNKNGEYEFEAGEDKNYVFLASAEGFLNQKKSLYTGSIKRDTLIYVDFEMIPYNKPIVLEHIFYDFNSSSLRSESAKELDELIFLLKENPELIIELRSHADRKGSADYNYNLSLKRAQSVLNYLEEHGINKARLKASGFGKGIPKKINKKIAEIYNFFSEGDVLDEQFVNQLEPYQQEIADQINRRTEFMILDLNQK